MSISTLGLVIIFVISGLLIVSGLELGFSIEICDRIFIGKKAGAELACDFDGLFQLQRHAYEWHSIAHWHNKTTRITVTDYRKKFDILTEMIDN